MRVAHAVGASFQGGAGSGDEGGGDDFVLLAILAQGFGVGGN